MTDAPEAPWRRRFRAATISMPAWARDEPDRCAYLSNASGTYEVYAWDRSTGEHRQVTRRPAGTVTFSLDPLGRSIWWFDDTKGNEKGGWRTQPFPTGEGPAIDTEATWAAPSIEPGYATGLALGREAAVIGTAADGVHHIEVVRDGDASRIYEHRESCIVGGLSHDGTAIVIGHAEGGDNRNRDLRVVTLDGATVAELSDGPARGLASLAWAPIDGDDRLLVTRSVTGARRPAVWDVSSGDLVDLDLDLPGEVLGASWYPAADAVLLVHLWRGRSELHRYDLATNALTRVPTEPGMIAGARIRPDGELWYGISSSAVPPQVHCGAELLRPPGQPAPGGVAYSDLDVEGPGGRVHAFLAEPDGPRPHATVFRVHGGPAGLDLDSFTPGVQAWVDHGFAVVLVNYRGSTGYGKDWEDAIVGKPGPRELEDIAAVRDRVVDAGIADAERVILHGGSWGGYLTLLGVGIQPELWSLGISAVPLADLAAHYHQQSEPLQAYWRSLFGGTPDEIADVLAEISPIEHVGRINAPVFVLAGDNDPRCPIGQVMNYMAALEKAGVDHQLHRYDAGHGAMVVDQQIDHTQRYLDFAHRHLGTTAPIP